MKDNCILNVFVTFKGIERRTIAWWVHVMDTNLNTKTPMVTKKPNITKKPITTKRLELPTRPSKSNLFKP